MCFHTGRWRWFFHLPNTWQEPAKQKGAVALDKGGEEGEDTVDGERDEERLTTANPVGQSSPEEGPDHHPKVNNQTCGESKGNVTPTLCNFEGLFSFLFLQQLFPAVPQMWVCLSIFTSVLWSFDFIWLAALTKQVDNSLNLKSDKALQPSPTNLVD